MVIDYYNLKEQPFGVTPDPRYLYMTATHREAMASLYYGVMENRGFSALIAPPGMGKTTLLFELLQRCEQSKRTVFLFQCQPDPEVLLRNLLTELGFRDEGEDFAGMQERLNQTILEEAKQGRRLVVVVDETQNYRQPVLEALRMLSNFETSKEKLIHIILSGQPQLAETLFSPAIEQLRQRVSIMAALRPLNAVETRNYIEHRLRVAGYRVARPLFTSAAHKLIADYSQGIPRNINNYCFNAMSLGFALKEPTIGREIVAEVFRDLNLQNSSENGIRQNQGYEAQNGLKPSALPKIPASGRGLGLTLGAISLAATFCLAGVYAAERLNSSSQSPLVVPAPPPPAAVTSSAAVNSEATAEAAARPETGVVLDSNPEPSGAEERKLPVAVQEEPPAAKPEPVKLVKASQHETLVQLCARNLARCDAGVLREIQRLNPWLHNANQLEPGQPVRVPVELPGKKSHKAKFVKSNSGARR